MKTSVTFVVLFVLGSVLTPALAKADLLLEKAVGTWTGRGWLKQSTDAPAETARCRIRNSYDASSSHLTLRGRCAVAGRSGTFDARIGRQDGEVAYNGRWSSQLTAGPATLRGERSGNSFHFDVQATDRKTGAPLTGTMIWQFGDNRFMIRNSRRTTEGRLVIVGEMVFDQ